MESFHIKPLNYSSVIIFFLLFPCFLCVVCQDSVLPQVSLLPPLPLIPDILNFLDQRLSIIYPIIQTFKDTITSDPFNVTGTWVGSDVCSYKGFFCSNPPDNVSATTVSSIDFNGFELSAPSIDHFIDQLPDIALFHANSNKFTGTISDKLAKLPYLYELDISNNELSGPFPMEILNMKDLSFLDIRFNSFSGSLPPEVFMQNVEMLFLNNNNFMQTLPENIGSTPAIYLTFANNKFTGPIPKSICNASSTLKEVLFSNNLLNGCIPYEVGLLREARVFDASKNLLTGPLPCSLGCLKNIEQLNFANNQLYGQVPEVLCEVKKLESLSLSNNYFTKVGPICRDLIKKGVLDLKGNCVPDLPDQRSKKECSTFFSQTSVCPNLPSYNLIPCRDSEVPSTSKSPTGSGSKTDSVAYKAVNQRHRL
ncbi:hypothetical protein ACOSP7_005207 [Xanthoceras sorbifolium]